jgi:type I restriction enzyme, S subunit
MAQIAIINIDDLGMAMRFDAQFYQLQYLIDTSKGKWLKIRDVLKKCEYGLSLAMNDEKNGVPMFKMDDISHTFLFSDTIRYAEVSESEEKRFKCKVDDVFFNRVNSEEFVGRTGIFKDSNLNAVFASYLIRLQPKKELVLPQFLNIFLNSKYGQKQIDRYKRRAVNQANVNAQELQEFFIPIPPAEFQKQIAELVDNSWQQLEKSKSLYSQAEQLLLQELGLEDFTPQWVAGYETNHDNLLEVLRIDAEYFQPKYRIIEDKVKEYKNGWDYLPKLIEVSKEKIQIEPEKEYRYVELADINAAIGIVDSTSKIFGANLPSRAQMKLQKDDVVVSSVEGSIDKIGLILSDDKNLVGSTGFHIFRPKAFTPEVNLILCKSPVLQYLFIREASGTILTAISSNSLAHIVVPKLDNAVQEKITKLVQESHKCVLESRQLLEQAKREVEEMIESKAT